MTKLQKIIVAIASVLAIGTTFVVTLGDDPIYVKYDRVFENNHEITIEKELGRNNGVLRGESILCTPINCIAVIYSGSNKDFNKLSPVVISENDVNKTLRLITGTGAVYFKTGNKKGFPNYAKMQEYKLNP